LIGFRRSRTNINQYVTGAVIKELREKNKMTQRELEEKAVRGRFTYRR
jgi:DNA-binding transcriptional regulator YiaG